MEQTEVTPAPETAGESVQEELFSEQFSIQDHSSAEDTLHSGLRAMIEAIVYITDEPLAAAQIAGVLQQPEELIAQLLEELAAEYAKPTHGLTIREIAGGYKMATKPEFHEQVRAFVKGLKPPMKLSLAALETLSVIAYKQPITAPEIMEIRGVQGAGVLKTLIDRKLIAPAGRKKVIGNPIVYKTTREFLIQFGLNDLNELPTLKEFEELGRLAFGDPEEDAVSAEAAAPPEQLAVDAVSNGSGEAQERDGAEQQPASIEAHVTDAEQHAASAEPAAPEQLAADAASESSEEAQDREGAADKPAANLEPHVTDAEQHAADTEPTPMDTEPHLVETAPKVTADESPAPHDIEPHPPFREPEPEPEPIHDPDPAEDPDPTEGPEKHPVKD